MDSSFAKPRNGITVALEVRCEDVYALIRAVFEGNCVVQVSLEDIVPSFLKDKGRRICLTYVK